MIWQFRVVLAAIAIFFLIIGVRWWRERNRRGMAAGLVCVAVGAIIFVYAIR